MAKRDYAGQAKRPVGMGPVRTGALVAAFVLLVAAGFALGFFFGRESGHQEAIQQQREQLMAEIKEQQRKSEALRRQRESEEADHTRFGELTFYTELPNESVEPTPLVESPAAKPSPEEPVLKPKTRQKATKAAAKAPVKAAPVGSAQALVEPVQEPKQSAPKTAAQVPANKPSLQSHTGARFRIQLVSYHTAAKAEAMRLRLAKMGIPSWVEAVAVAGRGRWYRVYVGPYASRSEAEKVRLRLKRELKTSGLLREE